MRRVANKTSTLQNSSKIWKYSLLVFDTYSGYHHFRATFGLPVDYNLRFFPLLSLFNYVKYRAKCYFWTNLVKCCNGFFGLTEAATFPPTRWSVLMPNDFHLATSSEATSSTGTAPHREVESGDETLILLRWSGVSGIGFSIQDLPQDGTGHIFTRCWLG